MSEGYDAASGDTLGAVLGEDAASLSDPALADRPVDELVLRLSGYLLLDPGSYVLEADPEAAAVRVGGVDLSAGPLALGLAEPALLPVSVVSTGAPGARPVAVSVATAAGPAPVSLEQRLVPTAEALFGEAVPEAEMTEGVLTLPIAGAALAAGLSAQFFALDGGVSRLAEVDFARAPDATAVVETVDYAKSRAPFWEGGPEDRFAAAFTGQLIVPESGAYTFYLTSDDGSSLAIGGATVIDNDGLHADRTLAATVDLAAGQHALDLRYFENGGWQTLELEWSGPATGGQRATIPASAFAPGAAGLAPPLAAEAAPPALGPADPVLSLVDTASDTKIGEIVSGARIALAPDLLARLSLDVAIPEDHPLAGRVGSVTLALDGSVVQTESFLPYALFGDNGGDYRDGGGLAAGAHLLTLTFHSEARGGGEVLATHSAAFVLEDGSVAHGPAVVPAVAVDDTARLDEDASLTVDVLANDGPGLAILELGDPAAGRVALEDGAVRYTPAADFHGEDVFTYTVADAAGGVATAAVLVTVDPVNDAPVAAGDEAAAIAGTPTEIDVLANDSDPDGDPLILTAASGALNGTVSVADGRLVYEADPGFAGTETLTYRVSDGQGGTAEGTLAVAVEAPDRLAEPTGGDGDQPDVATAEPPAAPPARGLAKLIDPVAGLSWLPDEAGVNGSAQLEKTHSVAFVTGDDIVTRQMIYEQGGLLRGLNLYIEGGRLVAGVWNDTAEQPGEVDWGWRNIAAEIEPGTRHVATLVLDGETTVDGSATLYLDGEAVGSVDGIGVLFPHLDDVGIGRVQQRTLIDGGLVGDAALPFEGEVETIAHYNAALAGTELAHLHAFMTGTPLPAPDTGDTDAGDPDGGSGNPGQTGDADAGDPDTGGDPGQAGDTDAGDPDTGGGDPGQAGDTDAGTPEAPLPGLLAQYFALPGGVSTLAGVDFDATPDHTCIVDGLRFSDPSAPFWEGGPDDDFAARFTGELVVAEAGTYRIHLTSDDGSAFFLDGERLIDHDGLHGATEKHADVELAAGAHAIEVLYFERGGNQVLELDWSGPDTGGMREAVPVSALTIAGNPGPCPATGEPVCHCAKPAEEPDAEPVPGNAPPEAADDAVVATLVNGMIHVALADILANDGDPDGDPLQVTALEGAELHGDEIMVTAAALDGVATFAYTLSDGRGGTDEAVVTVTLPGLGGSDDGGIDLVGGDGGSFDLGGGLSDDQIEAFVETVRGTDAHMHHHDDGSGHAHHHAELLALVPSAEATHIAIASGSWFDPAIWYGGEIPGDGAQAMIPSGIEVTYDGASAAELATIRVDGALRFPSATDTALRVDTIVVNSGAAFEMGSAGDPVTAEAAITFVDVHDHPDPSKVGLGLIGLPGARVGIHGAEKTGRVAVDGNQLAGDEVLEIEGGVPADWAVGDVIVLAGTQYDPKGDNEANERFHDEVLEITAIGPDGVRFVNLDTGGSALRFDHTTPEGFDFDIHAVNLSRSITFASAGGTDTPLEQRGHIMVMDHDSVVSNAALVGLGRTDKSTILDPFPTTLTVNGEEHFVDGAGTNVPGRYPLHVHRAFDHGDDGGMIEFRGNAVWDAPGWGIVLHGSRGRIDDNVVFDTVGSGIVTEDGDEVGYFSGNTVIKVASGTDLGAQAKHMVILETDKGLPVDHGVHGWGFWFDTGYSVREATDNVAVSTAQAGILVYGHNDGEVNHFVDPASAPAEVLRYAQDGVIDPFRVPVGNVSGNTVYNSRDGMFFAGLTRDDGLTGGTYTPGEGKTQEHLDRSVFSDTKIWGVLRHGITTPYAQGFEFRNMIIVGDLSDEKNSTDRPWLFPETGIQISKANHNVIIDNVRVEGFRKGIDVGQGGAQGYNDVDPFDLYSLSNVILANNTQNFAPSEGRTGANPSYHPGFMENPPFNPYARFSGNNQIDASASRFDPVAIVESMRIGPNAFVLDASGSYDPDYQQDEQIEGRETIENTIAFFQWDTDGDGAPDAFGRDIAIHFDNAGTNEVMLTLTDAQGAQTVRRFTLEPGAGDQRNALDDGGFDQPGSISNGPNDIGQSRVVSGPDAQQWGTPRRWNSDPIWKVVDGQAQLVGAQEPTQFLDQLVANRAEHRGLGDFRFDLSYRDADGESDSFVVKVWGITGSPNIGLYSDEAPSALYDSLYDQQPFKVDLLFESDNLLANGDLDWQTVSTSIDFGEGYDYLYVRFSASQVDAEAGDLLAIDNVVLGGTADAFTLEILEP